MMDISRIILEILGAIGGATLIILSLASWLGKIWASKILEEDKAKYAREIELLKTQLSKDVESFKCEIDLAKLSLSRYSENQFNLYNKLWISLVELKLSGDILWDKATFENLFNFIEKLRKTKEELLKNALLIEDGHYKQLNELLNNFSNYAVGKHRLIELDKNNKLDLGNALERYSIASDNKSTKNSYEKLLSSIQTYFKEQLKR